METNNMNDASLSGEIGEKKTIVGDKLKKREDERQAELKRRREEKSVTTSAQENANFFNDNFQKEKSKIENELLTCDSLPKDKLSDRFDAISVMHQKLQKFLADSTMFLPSYEVRQAQEFLTKLQTQIQEKREEMIPKKKFAFRSKKKAATGQEKNIASVIHTDKLGKESLDVGLAECKFIDCHDQTLEKFAEEINMKDVALARLESCVVKLYGAPSAIHINKLKNCKIFTGPVSGSIFITNCQNCTFVAPCQQLRIHTTKDSKFYTHVTSRAIIEDCSEVSFAPYNWLYTELDKHYELSGLDKNRNSWDDIDDFNWLAVDTPSPNWCILPENQRVLSWN